MDWNVAAQVAQTVTPIVGCVALVVYFLQKRDKVREAATLVLSQIDGIHKDVVSLGHSTSDNAIDLKTVYESLPIIGRNHWDEYKHLLVKYLDRGSYEAIDSFYRYAQVINDQQVFAKFLMQNYLTNVQFFTLSMESSALAIDIKSAQNTSDMLTVVNALMNDAPQNTNESVKQSFESVFKKFTSDNQQACMERLYAINGPFKRMIDTGILRNTSDFFTKYTPEQIAESVSKAIDAIGLLSIKGLAGYRKLQRLAR